MERRIINPWTWQDQYGYVQANEVTGAQRVLMCAGQTSVDESGTPLFADDMGAQMLQALSNVEAVLGQAGFTLADIMRLNIYVTDIDAAFEAFGPFAERLGAAGCRYAGTMLQVQRLAFPGLMVELEATAVA